MNSRLLLKVEEILYDNDITEYEILYELNYISKNLFYTINIIHDLENIFYNLKNSSMNEADLSECQSLLDLVINGISDRL